jgi:hypothetical protein
MTTALKGPHDSLEVVASPIHGHGLRSVRTRRAGETLFVVSGKFINWPFDGDYAYGPNWIGTGWETWLVPERGNPIRFTNHSCVPNVIVSEGFVVVAIEDIPCGNEILLDYATTEVDPYCDFVVAAGRHNVASWCVRSRSFPMFCANAIGRAFQARSWTPRSGSRERCPRRI